MKPPAGIDVVNRLAPVDSIIPQEVLGQFRD
jgi:hypothetical protein